MELRICNKIIVLQCKKNCLASFGTQSDTNCSGSRMMPNFIQGALKIIFGEHQKINSGGREKMIKCQREQGAGDTPLQGLINAQCRSMRSIPIRIDRHWDPCQNFDWHWALIKGVLYRYSSYKIFRRNVPGGPCHISQLVWHSKFQL